MDQAIHNKITSFIRGIKASLGSRSHLTPGSRTHSADPEGASAWRLTSENGETQTVAFEPLLAAGSIEILIAAARKDVGIAMVPASNCQEELASGALSRVLPDWGGIDGILHLVFASRRGMLPGVRAVIDFLAAALKSSAA